MSATDNDDLRNRALTVFCDSSELNYVNKTLTFDEYKSAINAHRESIFLQVTERTPVIPFAVHGLRADLKTSVNLVNDALNNLIERANNPAIPHNIILNSFKELDLSKLYWSFHSETNVITTTRTVLERLSELQILQLPKIHAYPDNVEIIRLFVALLSLNKIHTLGLGICWKKNDSNQDDFVRMQNNQRFIQGRYDFLFSIVTHLPLLKHFHYNHDSIQNEFIWLHLPRLKLDTLRMYSVLFEWGDKCYLNHIFETHPEWFRQFCFSGNAIYLKKLIFEGLNLVQNRSIRFDSAIIHDRNFRHLSNLTNLVELRLEENPVFVSYTYKEELCLCEANRFTFITDLMNLHTLHLKVQLTHQEFLFVTRLQQERHFTLVLNENHDYYTNLFNASNQNRQINLIRLSNRRPLTMQELLVLESSHDDEDDEGDDIHVS